MRFNFSIVAVLLAALLACGAGARAQDASGKAKGKGQGQGQGKGEGQGKGQGKGQGEGVSDADEAEDAEAVADAEGGEQEPGVEEAMATTENVNVTLTTGAGRISVRGWDRKEVRAQTRVGAKIKLHPAGGPEAGGPATRLEVLVSDKGKGDEEGQYESCDADVEVLLEVPHGATVYLKTQDGDVEVDGVAEAHVETNDGRIEARRITKAVDATSVGGNVALEEASGRARLSSLNGVVEVRDVRPLDGSDFLKIRTVSGDVLLDEIGPARVEVNTISGELRLTGALARGGIYDFTTTTGDVTLLMPADSSFKLNAKVSESGEIITEFPLKYKGPTSPMILLQTGRLLGTHGTGDATINLISFSGTLRLKKQ